MHRLQDARRDQGAAGAGLSTLATGNEPTPYRGRFAPSPTGPLHAGSLVAALASFLDAKHYSGAWQLRIDDIDPPRAVAGSVEAITGALRAHGLFWDGPLIFQSASEIRYERALQRLTGMGCLFSCICSRATLSERGSCGQNCEYREISSGEPHSLRVKTHPERMSGFEDRFLGMQWVFPDTIPKDFIVKRRDGLHAYQLAAAVDDAQPHITHVVRGADLLDSTYRQRWLQQLLKLEAPAYGHVPVVLDEMGNKLSKQAGAAALDIRQPEDNLRASLRHLGQTAPPSSAQTVAEILTHAVECWAVGK